MNPPHIRHPQESFQLESFQQLRPHLFEAGYQGLTTWEILDFLAERIAKLEAHQEELRAKQEEHLRLTGRIVDYLE